MSYLPAQPMIDAVNRALQHSAGHSGRHRPGATWPRGHWAA
jgi:hypothetical protein